MSKRTDRRDARRVTRAFSHLEAIAAVERAVGRAHDVAHRDEARQVVRALIDRPPGYGTDATMHEAKLTGVLRSPILTPACRNGEHALCQRVHRYDGCECPDGEHLRP
jgi:hypothetical protein